MYPLASFTAINRKGRESMVAAGVRRQLRVSFALTLLVIMGLLALGCQSAPSSPSTGAAGAPPAQDSQSAEALAEGPDKTGPGYIHNLPIGSEADVGHQVGEYVPEFSLELIDGQTVTATSQVTEGRPTFLFFWATT